MFVLKFSANYGKAYIQFLLLPVAIPLSLGLALPWVIKKQKEFLVNHYSFGETQFEAKFTTGMFYMIYLIAFGVLFIVGVVNAALTAILAFLSPELAILPTILVFSIGYVALAGIIQAGTANTVYGNSLLGDFQFESRQKSHELAVIYLTNTLALVLTLGLATPWAMIRLAKYRAACTALLADEALDNFTDQAEKEQSAIADEVGDIFDISVGV